MIQGTMRKATASSRVQVAHRPALSSRRPAGVEVRALFGTAKPNKEQVLAEVASQFDRWNAALATKDPKKVAAL